MSYRIAVDIGGTFTDCMVVDEEGDRTASKALTSHGSLWEGVLEALAVNAERRGLSRTELLAATELFVHGTTVATNAVIERKGARTGLITTHGHEDAIIIGKVFAKRAGLSEREIVRSSRLEKPEPIVPRSLIRGVAERIDRDGEVVVELQEDELLAAVDELLAEGVEAIAVSFLWSFLNEAHERRAKELIAARAGGVFATYSHEVAPLLGEYERTATTAMNAYVGPAVIGYLQKLEDSLRADGLRQPLLVMQASGGLTSVADASTRPFLTLDSGPTGGILGCQELGTHYGQENLICTDVGGTSFDVGLILHGDYQLDPEPVISKFTLRMPKVRVASIGSGGGSIAWLDDAGLLRVGPQSAGSRPGPACYGRGGTEPTVTDADLVLGYLDPGAFLGGRMSLDRDLAMRALGQLGQRLGMEPEEVAMGVFRIINAQMADLITRSTIELGHDPRDCVLVAYGGAGPTHAVFYGRDAGSRSIMVLPDSTVFSAEGMLTCDITHTEESSVRLTTPLSAADRELVAGRFAALEQRMREQFEREGTDFADVTASRTIGLHYRSQVHVLDVPIEGGEFDQGAVEKLIDDFGSRYGTVYGEGAVLRGSTVELERLRVVGRRPLVPLARRRSDRAGSEAAAAATGTRSVYFEEEEAGFVETAVYDGDRLRPGNVVQGPAIIQRMGDSVVVPPGWDAECDDVLSLHLRPTALAAEPGSLNATEVSR